MGSGVCMGYNVKCWATSLANCKNTCAKTAGCKMAEYSTGGTCCTSKYDSKKNCPGSFEASKTWSGYFVCAGSTVKTTPKKTGGCGKESAGVCMGYNIKCFSSTLANCKAQCKIQKVAKWPNTPRALKLAARPNTTAKKIVPAASPSRLLGRATPFARGNQRVQSERPSLSEAKLLAVRCQKEFAWDTTSNVSHQPWLTARHNAKRQKIAKWPNTPRALKLAARPNTTAKKNCPGSFTKSATWKGYSVCKGKPTRPPVRTTKPVGGEVACGAMSKGVCMGYNIKCFSS